MTEFQAYISGQCAGYFATGDLKSNPFTVLLSMPDKVKQERWPLEDAWNRGFGQGVKERMVGDDWPDTPDQRYTRATYPSTLLS